MRKSVLLLASMALALVLLAGGVALAAVRIGTNGPETLTGTNEADQITGKGGNDILRGKARNDVYYFDDGFGRDTLTETATVVVGTRRLPGGTDTLDFSRYNSGRVYIGMVRQWAHLEINAVDAGTNSVDLGKSPVENAVGGSANDTIEGGSASNTYSGGPGATMK